MVWFQCEDCGETLKKPKLAKHVWQCSAMRFSCIDCCMVFDRNGAMAHTSCVMEKAVELTLMAVIMVPTVIRRAVFAVLTATATQVDSKMFAPTAATNATSLRQV